MHFQVHPLGFLQRVVLESYQRLKMVSTQQDLCLYWEGKSHPFVDFKVLSVQVNVVGFHVGFDCNPALILMDSNIVMFKMGQKKS